MKYKKRKRDEISWPIYGRFLSNNSANIAPTITIAMIIPAVAGTKYMSAIDSGCADGAGVVAVSSPTNR